MTRISVPSWQFGETWSTTHTRNVTSRSASTHEGHDGGSAQTSRNGAGRAGGGGAHESASVANNATRPDAFMREGGAQAFFAGFASAALAS